MAFSVNDFQDLVQLLNAHPEWRGELRRLVLTDEILELPAIVRELAAAQKRTEARLEALAARVEELAEAQKRTEARVEELAEAHAEMQSVQQQMLKQLIRLTEDVSELKGYSLEQRYRTHAEAFFGTRYRNLRVIDPSSLDRVEEAFIAGAFTPQEWRSLNRLDALMRGTVGIGVDKREELMALEVSWVIDVRDVERAYERANILRRLGYAVQPAVGGRDVLESAKNRARELNVLVAIDGNLDRDEDALLVG